MINENGKINFAWSTKNLCHLAPVFHIYFVFIKQQKKNNGIHVSCTWQIFAHFVLIEDVRLTPKKIDFALHSLHGLIGYFDKKGNPLHLSRRRIIGKKITI